MKKFVKLGAMLSMTGILVLSTTGCSCSMSKKKIDAETLALSNSDLLSKNENPVDFTATYRETTTDENGVKSVTYIVSRDADTKTYYFTTTTGEGANSEEMSTITISQKVYSENGAVWVKETTNSNSNPVKTNYGETYYAYRYSSDLVAAGVFESDYYKIISGSYDTFKMMPYNGCATEGDQSALPSILATYLKKDEETQKDKSVCEKAKRKLFSKEYTFNINYRVSTSELVKYEIKMNKDDKLTYVKKDSTVAVAGTNGKKILTEFIISYDDVK